MPPSQKSWPLDPGCWDDGHYSGYFGSPDGLSFLKLYLKLGWATAPILSHPSRCCSLQGCVLSLITTLTSDGSRRSISKLHTSGCRPKTLRLLEAHTSRDPLRLSCSRSLLVHVRADGVCVAQKAKNGSFLRLSSCLATDKASFPKWIPDIKAVQ